MDRFNSALDLAEKRVGKLEGRFDKVTQNAAQDDRKYEKEMRKHGWTNLKGQ